MKVIRTKITTIEFDPDEERKRIKKLFRSRKYRDPLLNVIDVFEKEGIHEARKAYDKLPRHKEDEYPLQEAMGKWWYQINGDQWFAYEDNVKHELKFEVIKTEL